MSEANAVYERQNSVTPEDDKKISITDAISVNVSGTVALRDAKGTLVSRYLLAGVDYPHAASEVLATGTDADLGVTALYYA